jgi:hypothetical protein
MAFTLWLSAEEERILERIMRAEGTRNKEQAVIRAIRDKGALLAGDRQPGGVAAEAAADAAG